MDRQLGGGKVFFKRESPDEIKERSATLFKRLTGGIYGQGFDVRIRGGVVEWDGPLADKKGQPDMRKIGKIMKCLSMIGAVGRDIYFTAEDGRNSNSQAASTMMTAMHMMRNATDGVAAKALQRAEAAIGGPMFNIKMGKCPPELRRVGKKWQPPGERLETFESRVKSRIGDVFANAHDAIILPVKQILPAGLGGNGIESTFKASERAAIKQRRAAMESELKGPPHA